MEKILQLMSMDDYITDIPIPRWDFQVKCNDTIKTLLIRAKTRPDVSKVKQLSIKYNLFSMEDFDKLRVKYVGG